MRWNSNRNFAMFALAAGLFSIAGAVFNWDWFYESHKAASVVRTFGRQGARNAYMILGIFLILFGAFILSKPWRRRFFKH